MTAVFGWHCRILTLIEIGVIVSLDSQSRAECPERWLTWPEQGLSGVDGNVLASILWDPDGDGPLPTLLIIGGRFRIAGNGGAKNVAAWDGKEWHAMGDGVKGAVYSLIIHDGQLIAGSELWTKEEERAETILSWDGMNWVPLGGQLEGLVRAMAIFRGQLIAGGSFAIQGLEGYYLAVQWDGIQWLPIGVNLLGDISALAVFRDELVAGGSFNSIGGVSANGVAKWNGKEWQPLGDGVTNPGGASGVLALTLYNHELVAGGGFSNAGTVPTNSIASWDGSEWRSMGSAVERNRIVYDVTEYRGELVVIGEFDSIGEVPKWGIARWDGIQWHSFKQSPVLGYGSSLGHFDGELIVGGTIHGTSYGVVRWNGESWSGFNIGGTIGGVLAFAEHAGQLVAAGDFTRIRGIEANGVARLDGTQWKALGSGLDLPIRALGVHNGELLAAGSFSGPGSSGNSDLVRWDGLAWQDIVPAISGWITGLLVHDGKLVVIGDTQIHEEGQLTRFDVAVLDGDEWRGLGRLGGIVYAAIVYQGDLIVAGDFETADGVEVNSIARWDGVQWQPLGTGLDRESLRKPHGNAYAAAIYDGKLIVGGNFESAGGVAVRNIARWDGKRWEPLAEGLSDVRSLAVHDGRLIAAGHFESYDWPEVDSIASWNGDHWESVGSTSCSAPNVMTVFDGDLYLGGNFFSAGGIVSVSLARLGKTWGDISGDTEFRLNDLDDVVNCLSGPLTTPADGCECADVNEDGHADLADIAVLQRRFSRP
ncbi:MAG: hypothetical protein AABZ47_13240 [Planctomycetota bacterium]